jgi:hypothetical protein
MVAATFVSVPLSSRALAADPARGRLYALAAADDPDHADRLVVLDATSGTVVDSVGVGSDPTTISVTADGSTLWVGSLPSFEMRRVDLTGSTPVLGDTFALPPEWEASTQGSLVVVPPSASDPTAVLDFRDGRSGAYLGLVTFAPGAAIAGPASGPVAAAVVAGPPGLFFAYNGVDSGFEFYTVDTRSDVLDLVPPQGRPFLVYGYGPDLAYDPDGQVYASSGEVIDVRRPLTPRRAGRFAYGGTFLPLAGSDRVLAVSRGSVDAVHLLDARTFSRVSWLRFPVAFRSMRSPVALGPDRIAFAASDVGPTVYLTNAVETDPPRGRVQPIANPGTLEFPIPARALAVDPKRDLLYAAVGGGSSVYENRLVTIDPERGEVVNSVPIGANPVSLAVSEDASVLWVGLAGSSSVRRVDLSRGLPEPGPEYDLPILSQPGRIYPLPGRPRSVAVQNGGGNDPGYGTPYGNGYSGTAFLDDGVLRPGFFGQHFGASRMVAGPPGVFFGYDDQSSAYSFCAVFYDDAGVTQQSWSGILSGYNKEIVYDPDGYVYSSVGEVVDVRDPRAPSYVGEFEDRGAVLPLPGPAALMVSGNQLLKLDTPTLSVTGARSGCNAFFTITDLVHVSAGRIAYITYEAGLLDYGSICIVTDPEFIP